MSLLQKIEEKRKKKIRAERNKKAAIATVGVLAGTVAGILVAPKSGKETIQDVKDKSNQLKDKISDNVQETKVKVQDSKEKIREYLESRKKNKVQEDVEENISDESNELEVNEINNNLEESATEA
ncbi:MAG TPA: YtxH domain-containing protein [Clostridium sp.]|nr:YtxH domain-containing protein [Clostridium sp.]